MKIGGKYNWVNQKERLVYLGKEGFWHQFALVDEPATVWCEVLASDLDKLEETTIASTSKPGPEVFLRMTDGCLIVDNATSLLNAAQQVREALDQSGIVLDWATFVDVNTGESISI